MGGFVESERKRGKEESGGGGIETQERKGKAINGEKRVGRRATQVEGRMAVTRNRGEGEKGFGRERGTRRGQRFDEVKEEGKNNGEKSKRGRGRRHGDMKMEIQI